VLKIGILEGDDIGLEVVPECIKVMKAAAAKAKLQVEWKPLPIGARAHRDYGHTMPPGTMESLAQLDGWVLGPIGHRAYKRGDPTWVNAHPIFRRDFDLIANFKPVRSYPNLPSLHKNVDIMFLREATEGFQPDRNLYTGYGEFRPTEDMTISLRVITRRKSNFVARAAFEYAQANRRRKVTSVHKDTVFKLGCGMFAEECRKVAAEFPGIEIEEIMVDTFAMKLVMSPQQFDVVVTTNMFGDILTDEGAGLVGGLGLAPGLCASARHAMAQATHGSAPDIAGKGIANPYAMIMSGKMLFEWLALKKSEPKAADAARRIDVAMDKVIAEAKHLTGDLGGQAKTAEMGDAVAAAV
jgi:3-isopropylmalate dehydrogenase